VFWQLSEEQSIEQLNDPNINQLFQALYGVTADSIYGSFYSCPGTGFNTPVSPPIPNCDIYYNSNKSYDRQIAGFGEATIRLVDGLSLVAGARYSKLGFSLNHYSNGYENYGSYPAAGKQTNTAFTPRLGLDWQVNPDNLFYFTYAKGFRPGGFNAPLIPACGPGLIADGFSNGQAPLGYRPDTTQSFEVGSKNNFDNKLKIALSAYYIRWNDIQQNVYIAGNCGLQFTDNLGTAVAKGFDLQAQADLGSGFTFEFSAGYTDARFSKDSISGLALKGEAISGNAAINYAPGTSPPWTIAFGPQYAFKAFEHDAFVRLDWEYTSRNPWLAPVQDPNNASQYNYGFSYTLPATSFTSARAGIKLGGGWEISAFCDNLFNTHPVVNYALAQADPFNPAGPPTPQENDFTFRPRTIGITATLHR
jgi:iron complex outermembrane receptor protein